MIALLSGALALGYVAAGRSLRWQHQVPVLVAIAATLVRVWLSLDRRLIVEGSAGHDAHLFVWQAAHIIEGLWLGEYNYLTLIKGPFLSIWLALMFWLGVPYLLSLHILYALCSALMVRALRPILKSSWAAVGLYLLLLFNPVAFSVQIAAVVSRMGIYHSLTLGIAACSIGLFLRCDRPPANKLFWAGGLGAFLGCSLITREVGVWIFPMLTILGGGYLWNSRGIESASWLSKAAPIILAGVVALSAVQGVAYLNWKHYDIWQVTEFGHPAFRQAYGALSRISPDENIPYVPVTSASRQKAYSVSPAFSELETHFEGDVGLGWAEPGKDLVGLPVERREIAGGWFIWALREAAMWQEYHVWPTKAMDFYQAVADEVNAGCDNGRIDCSAPRATFVPVWRPEWTATLPRAFFSSLAVVAGFEAYAGTGGFSYGPDWVVQMFSEVTSTSTSPREGEAPVYASSEKLTHFKLRQLDKVARKYQSLGPLLAGISLVILVVLPAFRTRIMRESLAAISVPVAALLSAIIAYSMMLALIEISSFSTFNKQYLFPANGLLLTAIFLCLCLARELFRGDSPTRELDL